MFVQSYSFPEGENTPPEIIPTLDHALTMQEAFNIAYIGVTRQGKKSINGSGCAYRGCLNTKCAIGFLIPDQEYQHDFDSGIAHICYISEKVSTLKKLPYNFIRELQSAHDSARDQVFVTDFQAAMGKIAKEHSLVIPSLQFLNKKEITMFVQEYHLPVPAQQELDHEFTMQEAFNIAYIGVLKQGHQSKPSPNAPCRYRYRGDRCALGFLISDKEYQPAWDKHSTLPGTLQKLIPSWKNLPVSFLNNLQSYHDGWSDRFSQDFPTYYKEVMTRYAQANGLSLPIL